MDLTVREASPREREAICAATWPELPAHAGMARHLYVAVAGKHHDFLVGCLWLAGSGTGLEAGVAFAPAFPIHRINAARELIRGITPDPEHTTTWRSWVKEREEILQDLLSRGFRIERTIIEYEIPNNGPEFHRRLHRTTLAARKRLGEGALRLGWLDEEAVPEVRKWCDKHGLLTTTAFNSLFFSGAFDRHNCPVAWAGGQVAGFILVLKADELVISTRLVRDGFRGKGLNAILLAEIIVRKNRSGALWYKAVFRAEAEIHLETKRMCLRFGGKQTSSRFLLTLPPEGTAS